MMEIPEAAVIARQLNETVKGKVIVQVEAEHSPHKLAWYHGDPKKYPDLLKGKAITEAYPLGGTLEIRAEDAFIALSEGPNLTFLPAGSPLPQKHQLLLQFEDGSALYAAVQMYGGILCFRMDEVTNPYYLGAKSKPSPLLDAFDRAYFDAILSPDEAKKLSAKALLAAGQRVPGLGNGVLQDILFNAKIHPKRSIASMSTQEVDALYESVKSTLKEMADKGGRDTERDLFGNLGGYATKCSKLTVGKPCGVCGGIVEKAAYMGGSIYFCPSCQKL
jgi:formamidopyrimidine-DNA glycosylase